MFERYTKTARRVIFFSRIYASWLGSHKIDTEHLLLSLLSRDQGLARRFLGSAWAADSVWQKIEQSGRIGKPIVGRCDLPLSSVSKRVLSYAAQEANQLASKTVSTEHLLLGLLREQDCFAAEFLDEHSVHLAQTRQELMRTAYTYSASEEFVRQRDPLPKDVVEMQAQVRAILNRVRSAVAQGDVTRAREYSGEERVAHEKLRSLYQQYGLLDWLYE